MEESQLIEIVSTLRDKEKANLLKYAAFDFVVQGRMKKYIAPLLGICLNHDWSQKNVRLKKEDIYHQLFPGEPLVQGKLEKIMVEAHKVVRNFLLMQHYFRPENEFNHSLDYVEILRTRSLSTRFDAQLARLIKKQEENPCKTEPFFFNQLMLDKYIQYVESIHNQNRGDLHIVRFFKSVELYYFLQRLSLMSRLRMQLTVTSLEIDDSIKPLLNDSFIPQEYIHQAPCLEISNLIFSIIKKELPALEDLVLLKKELNTHGSQLDYITQQEFYTYLRNSYALLTQKMPDREDIRKELQELYKENLASGYLHHEGKITPSRFLSITKNAIKLKEYDWAYDFMEQNKGLIIGDNETHDIYRMVKANYLFVTGKHSECLDYIPPTSPFVNYMVDGKRLELKALYELRSDLLPFKLDTFKMFLSRTSVKILSTNQKFWNNEFANFLTQLVTSKPGDETRSEIILKRLQEKKFTAEWLWLQEKAAALDHKR